MTKLEEVARAICEAIPFGVDQADAAKAARAAIEALREPTEAMKEAGAYGPTSFSYGDDNSFSYIGEDDARSCWQSMIDAILKEGDEQATRAR